LKAEASGYPVCVRSSHGEDQNIETFFGTEGVRLVGAAIQPMAPKRGITKLCSNFMWRQLTERNNRTKTNMISEPQEMYLFHDMPGIEVADFLFPSDAVVWASWRYMEEENIPSLRHTNEVIVVYVNAGARLNL
jgi:hypothetical protein